MLLDSLREPGGSAIGWTGRTWNPTVGCTEVSEGCDGCYARVQSERLQRFGQVKYEFGFTPRPWPPHLDLPLTWKKPAFIFVNSMSDLFHKDMPLEYVAQVWRVMLEANWHVYQVLTKRPHWMERVVDEYGLEMADHIWVGTSTESQKFVHNRIPPVLRCRPAMAFISAEPLLQEIDVSAYLGRERGRLNWVISGGESGRTAETRRPAQTDWFRLLRDQCAAAGVPYFHKQGNHRMPGRDRLLDGREHNALPMLES